jgi:GAF domain-containing protein
MNVQDYTEPLPGTFALKEKLQEIAARAAQRLGADVVTLYLYDEKRDQFYMPVGVGLSDQATFENALPRPDRIAGKIVKEGRVVIANEARSHPEMSGPFAFRERIASAAGFPVRLGDMPAGVFFVNYRTPHTFTAQEERVVKGLLQEIADVFGATQLAELVQSPIPSPMALDQNLDWLLQSACNLAKFPAALWILDPAAQQLTIRSSNGLSVGFIASASVRMDADNFITAIMRTGERIAISDLEHDGRFPFQEELPNAGWESMLAGPVFAAGRVVGVLAIFSFARTEFATWQRTFLADLTERISGVLEEDRRSRALAHLYAIGLALVSPTDLKEVLRLIVDKAAEVFGADLVTLYPYDQKHDEFGDPIAIGVKPEFFEHPTPSKTGTAAHVVREKQPVFSDNAVGDPRMSQGFIARHQVKSSVAFPLLVTDEVLGVLFINYRTPYDFSPNDRELLALFANQAAAAINNARLFEEQERRVTLAQIAKAFSEAPDRERTLQAIVDGARQLTGATKSAIFLHNPETGSFDPAARSPTPRDKTEGPRAQGGLTRLIMEKGEPLLIGDASQDPRVRGPVVEEGVRSILGVPVQIKGERVGALYVNSTEKDRFRGRDIEFLQDLASYGAIALERTLLLEAITHVNEATSNLLRLDDLIKELLNKAVNQLCFDFATLQLVNLETNTIEAVDGVNAPWSAEARHDSDSDDVQAWVVRNRQTQVIAGPDPRFDRAIYERYGHQDMIRAFVPIMVENTAPLGTVEAGYHFRNKTSISDEEKAALEALVAEYAPAIWRATLACALREIVQNAVRLVRADSGSIHIVYNPVKGQYVYAEGAGRIGREFLDAFPPGPEGIGHAALEKNIPIWIDKPEELERRNPAIYRPEALWDAYPDKYPSGQGVRAIACFPFARESKYAGVLYIHYWQPHKFSRDEIKWLEMFAGQLSSAIQNVQFYEKLRGRTRVLTGLSAIGESLVSDLQLDRLLKRIAHGARDVLGADIVTIYQYHQDRDSFVTPPTIAGQVDQPSFMSNTVDRGDAQWEIVHRKQSVYASDARVDNILCNTGRSRPESKKEPFVVREGIVSAAGIPLTVRQEIVGVIFINYRTRRDFTDSERRVIDNFASYAAIAIRNARQATQQKIDQLRAIQDIDREIDVTLDLDALLQLLVDKSMAHLHVDGYGVLQLYEEKTRRLVTRAHRNLPEDTPAADISIDAPGITARAARDLEPVLVEDARQTKEPIERVPGILSEVAVPLIQVDRLVGVLNLKSRSPHAFDAESVDFLTLLASQAVVAIQNARYVQQLEQLRRGLQAITSTTDLREVLAQITKSTLDVLGADDAVIFPFNPVTREFMMEQVAHSGQSSEKNLQLGVPEEGGIAYTVLRQELVVVDDVETALPEIRSKMGRSTLEALGVEAFVGVALKVQDKDLGVLYVDYQSPHHFTESDLGLIRAFADQAAIAIDNALLYEDMRRQARDLDTLYQVTRQIGSFADLQERSLLEAIVKTVRETLHATCCTLFRLNDQEELILQVRDSISGGEPGITRFRLGEGLAGWVAQTSEAALVHDVNLDPHYIPMPVPGVRDIRSMILAPFWDEGRIVGVISADQDRPHAFNERNLSFLAAMAIQAGSGIFQARQRRRRVEAVVARFNPYVVGTPIRDPEKFYGRRQVIQRILGSIHNNHFIVCGERRIGKTSLLYQLAYHLTELSSRSADYYMLPVLVNLQKVAEADFFRVLIAKIAYAANVPQGTTGRKYTYLACERDVDRVVDELKERYPGKEIRIVLLLDEMDEFVGYSSTTHEAFRSLMQSPCGEHLSMVVAGVSVRLTEEGITSPWYNMFKERKRLSPLTAAEARQLLIEPVQKYYTYSTAALDLLLNSGDLRPQELQRLGSLAVDEMLNRIHAPGLEEHEIGVGAEETTITREDAEQAIGRAQKQRNGEPLLG